MTRTRVYISDFDFTILQSDQTLPVNFAEFLDRVKQRGIIFTVATARGIHALDPLLSGHKFHLPIIELNGAYLTNHQTRQPLHIQHLDEDLVVDLIEISSQLQLHPVIFGHNGSTVIVPPMIRTTAVDSFIQERIAVQDPRFLSSIASMYSIELDHVVSLIYMGTRFEMEQLRDAFEGSSLDISIHFYQNKYTPEYFWLSVHDSKATKEAGILRFLSHQGLQREHIELIVFGDDVNDMGMFEIADTAVAVANAKPELKNLATEVIGSNDEGAVLQYIIHRESL